MRESVIIGTGVGLMVAVLSGVVFFWVMYFLLVYVWPMTISVGCVDLPV